MAFTATATTAFVIATLNAQAPLPMEPEHRAGQGITGAFEGWFENKDGTATIIVGYFNRNLAQELSIPVGAANRIEPGGPDRGQPTHFLPGRQWGVFTIRVPREAEKLTWTIEANGKATVIPLKLDPLWIVNPYLDASGNTPPWIRFEANAEGVQGPPLMVVKTVRARVGESVDLTTWVVDDARAGLIATPASRGPAVALRWSYLRAPVGGSVEFSPTARPPVQGTPGPAKFAGKAASTAKFTLPGEYLLGVTATDWSGEGGSGFQCCWSSAQVLVRVVQ